MDTKFFLANKKAISRSRYEFSILILSSLVLAYISSHFDGFEELAKFAHHHEKWEVDEIFTTLIILGISFAIFSYRRWQELQVREKELFRSNLMLKKTLKELKVLKGLLPICSACKKIRDADGDWEYLEKYISDRSEAEFTHGICPPCRQDLYGI